jgi:hypothetical protein
VWCGEGEGGELMGVLSVLEIRRIDSPPHSRSACSPKKGGQRDCEGAGGERYKGRNRPLQKTDAGGG